MATNINKPKPQGSGFTNLQRIMNANRGTRLGQAVGQGIQETGEQARQGLQQAQSEFNQQSEAGRLDTDANRQRVEDVLSRPDDVNEQDFKDFDRFRAGGYTGPLGLKNAGSVTGQAQEAQNLGQQVGTAGGRQALLQRYAAGPNQYQAGQQRLDSLLLGATGGKDLKSARRSVSGLGQQAQSAQQGAQEVGQQYQSQAQGFGRNVAQRAGEGAQTVLTPAQEAAKLANERDASLRTQAEQERQRGSSENYLSRQALEALGLQAGDRTYGVNLGDVVRFQGRGLNEAARPEELMNQEQFQRFSNLKRLMGSDLQGYDPTKVGGYEQGQLAYDKEGLNQAIAANRAKLAPVEGDLAMAQRIQAVYDKHINSGKKGWGNAARAEIAAFAPGAVGGSDTQNLLWARTNLANAQQRFNDMNKNYLGNITTDEESQG